ncbi:helix-turn-helix domain-containing protein [Actinoplanes sp. GCM10030250]|uniref:helix-turn-helix domain-containing protein n=1 Tax=Actinoplanes sp. GCM10030250 TaxID=3273376 RepID=UPI0036175699
MTPRIELLAYSAPNRVVRALATLSGLFGNGTGRSSKIISVKQTDLADLAGTSREVTVRVLRALREAGVVRTRRSRIEVIDSGELVDRD